MATATADDWLKAVQMQTLMYSAFAAIALGTESKYQYFYNSLVYTIYDACVCVCVRVCVRVCVCVCLFKLNNYSHCEDK